MKQKRKLTNYKLLNKQQIEHRHSNYPTKQLTKVLQITTSVLAQNQTTNNKQALEVYYF